MLMPLYRTTRSVGTARSNDNINGNVQNYSDHFSDVLHFKCFIGETSACQGWVGCVKITRSGSPQS